MEQQRKGDFTLKYNNVPALLEDSNLTTAEKVVELVKHHAMCLFGLATDVSNYYDKLDKLQAQLNVATAKCKNLEQSNVILRAQLRDKDRTIKQLRQQLKQQGSNDNGK